MNEESIKREENSLRIQVSVSIVRQMGFEIPLQENVSAGVHGGRPSKDSDNYQLSYKVDYVIRNNTQFE